MGRGWPGLRAPPLTLLCLTRNPNPMRLAFSTNAYLRYPFDEAADRIAAFGYEGLELMADVPHAWPAGLLEGPKRAHPRGDGAESAGVLERQCVHDERDQRLSPAVLVSLVHRARPALPPGPDRPHPARPHLCAELGAPHITTEPGGPLAAGQAPPGGDRPVRRGPQAAGRARPQARASSS